jgi:hypothetical protein
MFWLFALLGLGAAAASANAQRQAGKQQRIAAEEQKKASELNAYNIQTERILSKAEALQRHNDRLEDYRNNLSANIAAFSKLNRDVRLDRSVGAFLENQREIAVDDTRRSDFMGWAQESRMATESLVALAEGRAALRSGIAAEKASRVGAFTTLVGGLMNFGRTF